MKIWVATLAAATAFASCGRTEEPVARPIGVAVPPAQPTSATPAMPAASAATPSSASGPSSTPTPARCVVPMPETPAPKAAKAAHCPPDPTGNLPLARGTVTFEDAPQQPRVSVELAREPAHRERGLMYRTSMASDAGMLFSWSNEEVRSFWMRNTCIPLDMLFVARDGTITGVLEQVPTMNQDSRSIPCPAAHVLELNAGWVRQHGVRPGQRIRIEG